MFAHLTPREYKTPFGSSLIAAYHGKERFARLQFWFPLELRRQPTWDGGFPRLVPSTYSGVHEVQPEF